MQLAGSDSGPEISPEVFEAVLREHGTLPEKEGSSKVLDLGEAVDRLVRPGMSLYFGFGHARAHAASFEIIRRFWNTDAKFHLITAAVLEAGLVMVHGGLVNRVTAAYAGNTYPVPSPNRIFQDAIASRRISLEEVSNLTITTRLMAGALGLPFIPTRSITGTSLATPANGYGEIENPFAKGAPVGALRALEPDLAVIHAYAADAAGNAIMLGPYGEESWGALASSGGVLLTVEKLVSTQFIREHAHLVRIPAHVVRSVSVAPFGAHPQPMTNFGLTEHTGYGEDYEFRSSFRQASRSDEALDAWINTWILGCSDHASYIERLGVQRLQALSAAFSEGAWRSTLTAKREGISRSRTPTNAETMIIIAAREIMGTVLAKEYTTVLAGAGVANLAAWLAVSTLKRQGVNVELMAEAGFYGYAPRFGDPYLFSVANMFSNKMHASFLQVLGLMAGGPHNKCLAVIGAGQIDQSGNINSTRQTDGRFLVGSGGANDLGNTAHELMVLCSASRQRLVESVPYVTTSGQHVGTLVTQLGVFEKSGADKAFELKRWTPGAVSQPRAERESALQAECGWTLRIAGQVAEHEPVTATELATLRLFDPERIFTS